MAASAVQPSPSTSGAAPTSVASDTMLETRSSLFPVTAFTFSTVFRTDAAFELGVAVRPYRLNRGLVAPTSIASPTPSTMIIREPPHDEI
ncbi:hypothetical protein MY1884_004378 [Beauveria asiatica]